MATLTKATNTSPWALEHTVSKAGTESYNLETVGTFIDRNIGVAITTPAGSATTPDTSVTANPSLSTAFTTNKGYEMTVSATQNVTPTVSAGWVSTGTAGKITVSGSSYVPQSAVTLNYTNSTAPTLTSSTKLNNGGYIKVGAGYYPTDRYYQVNTYSAANFANGDKVLTAQTGTSVVGYSTASAPSASVTYAGGAPSIKSSTTTATNGAGITMTPTNTDPGSGVYFTTGGTAVASRAAFTYTGTPGWYDASSTAKTASDAVDAVSETSLATNRYYITKITVPKNKSFAVDMTSSTSELDSTHVLTVLNGSYRQINVTNAANGCIYVDGPAKTYFTPNPSSSTTGTLLARGYNDTTLDTEYQYIIKSGQWVKNTVTPSSSAQGPYYGKTTVSAVSQSTAQSIVGNATFANTATSGVSYTDYSTSAPVLITGDYLYINAGYTPARKISLARLVPDSYSTNTISTTAAMRTGYYAWDNDGKPIVGAMSNATITSGSATISSLTYTWDTTNSRFNVTGSATVSAPTVSIAGYISSTSGEGTKNTNTASVSATLPKVGTAVDITNGGAVDITISRTAKPSGDTWTDAANGAAITTKPTSGVYIQVNTAKNTKTLTATPKVSSAGYGTTTYYGATSNTSTVGANASSNTYIPIKTTTLSFSGGGLTGTGATVDKTNMTFSETNVSGVTITPKGTAGRTKVTYSADASGWVSVTNGTTVSSAVAASTWNGTVQYVSGVTIAKPSSGSRYFDITVPNGDAGTVTFRFTVDSAGNTVVTSPA